MAKSKQDALVERLHAQGLRKRVARTMAEAMDSGRGRKPPAAVKRITAELRGIVSEVEQRTTGKDRAKRSAAAKKAAATRKRNAAKRSAAAKKGAKTRAKA